MLLNQLLRDPEPQPGAFLSLGRIKGGEEVLANVFWYTGAVVGNDDSVPLISGTPVFRRVNADRQPALCSHSPGATLDKETKRRECR